MIAKTCQTCGKQYKSEADFLDQTSRWRLCERGHLWFNCSCHSTLMLKKNQYDWFSPDKNMNERSASLFNKLHEKKHLPLVKSIVIELEELLSDPDYKQDKVITVLKRDPILMGEVIMVANRYVSANEENSVISSLEHAVTYLGPIKVKDVVLTTVVKEIEVNTLHFKVDEFWEESFSQALVAEYLAKTYAPYLNMDEMYLTGFLANVGKLVAAFYYPDQIDSVSKAYKNPKNIYAWHKLEKIMQMESSLSLAEVAANFWGFPEYILQSFEHNYEVTATSARLLSLSDFVVFTHIMTAWVNYKLVEIDYEVLNKIIKRVGIRLSQLEEVAKKISQYVARSKMPLKAEAC